MTKIFPSPAMLKERKLVTFMLSLLESVKEDLIDKTTRIVENLQNDYDNQELKKKYKQQLLQEQRELNQAGTHAQILEIEVKDPTLTAEQRKVVQGLTGLFDVDDCRQLKHDLFKCAGCVTDPKKKKPKLINKDTSTWTWDNLDRLSKKSKPDQEGIMRLLVLQAYARKGYVRMINSPFLLLEVKECRNISEFRELLNPQDKHDMTHSAGNRISFNLDAQAFNTGNIYNSMENLQTLKYDLLSQEFIWLFQHLADPESKSVYRSKLLTDETCRAILSEAFAKQIQDACDADQEELKEEDFVNICLKQRGYIEMVASPIHSVTLPPEARVKASIPQDAHFYAFCYPLLSTEFEGNLNLDVSVVSPPDEVKREKGIALILDLKLDLATSFPLIQDRRQDLLRDFAQLLHLEGEEGKVSFNFSLQEIEMLDKHKNALDNDILGIDVVSEWLLDSSSHVKVLVMNHSWKSSKGNYFVPGIRFQIIKKLFASNDSKIEGGLTKSRLNEIFGGYLFMPHRSCDELRKSCDELLQSLKIAQGSEDRTEARAMDWGDPFCNWLLNGGFVYFDHKYDIIAINAIYLGEMKKNAKVLYVGAPSKLPDTAISSIDEGKRWVSVTEERFRSQGFTHFAWICPSEFVGDHIYTKSGGFAFRHRQWEKSEYYPVGKKAILDETSRHLGVGNFVFQNADQIFEPLKYDAPIHIIELSSLRQKSMRSGVGPSRLILLFLPSLFLPNFSLVRF